MSTAHARSWKKISCSYGLTMLFAGVFDAFELHAGKNLRRERARSALETGQPRYPWRGYLIPILYTVPVYAIVWMSGSR